MLTHAVPGIGFADVQGRYWRPAVRGRRVVLERAREHEELLAIVPGSPLDFWLYKSGHVAAVGEVWDDEGTRTIDWRKPHAIAGATDALAVTGHPDGCLLRAGGRLDCFSQRVRTDNYGIPAAIETSSFVTVAESGVDKVVGRGATCFLKKGRVHCVHLWWTPEMPQPKLSERIVDGIEGADDLCVAQTTASDFPLGCARVARELQCWKIEDEGPRPSGPYGRIPVRFTQPTNWQPGLRVQQLDCNAGALAVLDEQGRLWIQRYWEASAALHVAEGFGRLKAFQAQIGLICGVDPLGSLLCCGEAGGSVPVGSGKYGPECVPTRVFAEDAVGALEPPRADTERDRATETGSPASSDADGGRNPTVASAAGSSLPTAPDAANALVPWPEALQRQVEPSQSATGSAK